MLLHANDIETLIEEHDGTCVSMFMPTHRAGPEGEQVKIRLKNLVSEAGARIERLDPPDRAEIRDAVERLEGLRDDETFWRHSGDGLAVYVTRRDVSFRRLSVDLDEHVAVGTRFAVRPVLPAVSSRGRFYVLVLSQNSVRLLECSPESAREIDDHDIPGSLADALGYDWEQKSLQFHTGDTPSGTSLAPRAAVYHGHGAGSDRERKDEVKRFLHAVDRGLRGLLGESGPPLVVASVDYEADLFRSITKYRDVLDEGVSGNQEARSTDEVHADALAVVRPILDKDADEARRELRASWERDGVARGVEEALRLARDSRVGTLFVCPEAPVWGAVDAETGRVEVHDTREEGDIDLIDEAVALTLRTGGRCVTVGREEMPGGVAVAAVRRY